MTEEEARRVLGEALALADPDADVFEWHPCRACHTGANAPCPCAGGPYLAEPIWQAIRPLIRTEVTL